MFSLFADLPPEYRLTIIIIGSVLLTVITIVLACLGARLRRLHLEADVKTDMLERGLTPDEIRQVLSTPMRGKRDQEIKAELKERLVEKGLDPRQIKEIIQAGDEWWRS